MGGYDPITAFKQALLHGHELTTEERAGEVTKFGEWIIQEQQLQYIQGWKDAKNEENTSPGLEANDDN